MRLAVWLKENIEAIAIAIVMALVIRQFAIEAFKIPTGSMMPTLFGDRGDQPGDRILVDKISVLFRDPDRYDVIVFKYPLNKSKNYIKRLVGLGGETLGIRDGDVFINGEIARKPPHVQDALFFEVYPGAGVEGYRKRQAARRWERSSRGGSLARVEDGGFRLEAGDGECMVAYGEAVRDLTPWATRSQGGSLRVGDVKIEFEVTPEAGEIVVQITENRVLNELVLAVGGGTSSIRHGDGPRDDLEGVVLEPGESVAVSFANVDDALRVEVDGDEFDLLYSPVTPDHRRDGIRFGVRNGEALFTDLRLYRDLHYISEGNCRNVKIPPNHFYVLGDNTMSSKDSRKWVLQRYEMEDGTEYFYDNGDNDDESKRRPGPRPGTVRFQDRDGVWRTLDNSEIASRDEVIEAPYIPRENLIGVAFFVFWPLPPFCDSFRMKFIR